jgi:hypothetical protein
MKTNLLRISILAAGAVAVSAQDGRVVTANIPFEFNVPGASMPAGAYRVDLNSPNMLVLRAGGHATAVMTRAAASVNPPDQAKLVFDRAGNTYFLADVWSIGTFGRRVPTTRQERNLAKRMPAPDRVIVAAR